MISDKIFGFSKSAFTWSVQFLLGGIGATFASPFLLFTGSLFAAMDSIWDSKDKSFLLKALAYHFGAPFIAAGAFIAAPIAFTAGCVAGFFGGIAWVGDQFRTNARQKENDRIFKENQRIRDDERRLEQSRRELRLVTERERSKARALERAEIRLAKQPSNKIKPAEQGVELHLALLRANQEYLNARPHQRQERLATLIRLYQEYQSINGAFSDPGIERTIHAGLQSPAQSKADKYAQHLRGYNQIFKGRYEFNAGLPNMPLLAKLRHKAKPVLEAPLTDEQLALLEARLFIKKEDTEEVREEKNRNRRILNAAIEDKMARAALRMPVRLPDGRTYDLLTVINMSPRILPTDPTRRFDLTEMVPNNTLGKAILFLLESFKNPNYVPPQAYTPDRQDEVRRRAEAIKKQQAFPQDYCLTDADVQDFNQYYLTLARRGELEKYKLGLFDIMCKDPITGVVFQDPVYLTEDGYTYERSTLLALLAEGKGIANCPGASHIQFTAAHIKTCYSTRDVLHQIKLEIDSMKKKNQVEQELQQKQLQEQQPQEQKSQESTTAGVTTRAQRASQPSASIKPPGGLIIEDEKFIEENKSTQCEPVRPPLTIADVKKIGQHVITKSPEAQEIFRVACFDDMGLMRNPLRGPDGQTRELETWGQDQRQSLLPDNTLLAGYQQLLVYIDTGKLPEKVMNKSDIDDALATSSIPRTANSVLGNSRVQAVENFYQRMTPIQKLLFDTMCRDPITGKIFQNPVFLPDGRTYEESTVELFFKSYKSLFGKDDRAIIPGTNIVFTRTDVKPCERTKRILRTLVRQQENQAKSQQKGQGAWTPRFMPSPPQNTAERAVNPGTVIGERPLYSGIRIQNS